MLADVEVDIFRPWVQNATKKGHRGRGAEEGVVGWCTAVQTCSTSELSVVGACRDLDQASRSTHREEKIQIDVGDPDPWDESRSWAHNLSARYGSERGQRGGVPLSAGRHPKLTMILE